MIGSVVTSGSVGFHEDPSVDVRSVDYLMVLLDGTQSVPTKACGVPTVPSTVPAVLCKEVQKD